MDSSTQIQYCYRLKYSYYFRLKTPASFRLLYPDFRKEIKKSLKTTNQSEARKLASLWYNETSIFIDAVILNKNYKFTIESLENYLSLILSLNFRNSRISNFLDNTMSRHYNAGFSVSFRKDGSIKSAETVGNTADERREDAKDLLKQLNALKDNRGVASTFKNEGVTTTLNNSTFSDLINSFLEEDRKDTTEKTHKQKMFWMPLLGLYTGARISELAQLDLSDIKLQLPLKHAADIHEEQVLSDVKDDVDGIWFISINDEDNKRTKNFQSIRNVPIHLDLIKLGFLDFVRQQRYGKYKMMLFTNFSDKAVLNNNCGSDVSKWFNGNYGTKSSHGFKQAAGIASDSSKTFHSFRKIFARYLRINGVGDAVIGDLIGHETLKVGDGGSITTLSYTGSFALENLNEAIHKLNYDLDLTHLSYTNFLKMYSKEYKALISKQKREDRL